jgi:translocation and assembly module TamB
MRTLKITLMVIAALILVPVAALLLIAGTETGTRFAFERTRALLPDGVTLGRVEGRLADRLVVHDVAIDNDGMRLRLARAELHWTPSSLGRGHVVVRDLQASGMYVELLPGEVEPEPEPTEPFALPDRIGHYVDITLERVGISDIVIHAEPEAEPIQIDEVELAATLIDSRLDLERFVVASPLLSLDARMTVTAAGDYPIEGRFEWTLRPPDLAELVAVTRLHGSFAELRIQQQIAAPYHTEVNAVLTDLLGRNGAYVAATARVQQLRTAAIGPELTPVPMTFSLDARLDGPLDALRLAADARVEGLEQGTVDARVSALLGPDAVQLHELVIMQPTHDGRLHATGRIAFGADLAADLHVAWESMQWPLEDAPTLRSARGELHFAGQADDYRLRLDAAVELPGQPAATLELSGAGDLETLALELRALTDAGRVTGHAELAWAPALTGRVELTGADIDPGAFADDWPGRVGFTLVAAGGVDDDIVRVRLHGFDASGTVRDAPLTIAARGSYRQRPGADDVSDHAVDVDALRFSLGSTRLDVEGRIADTADLQWRLDAPELAGLHPTARGRIAGQGTVTGALPRPRIRAELQGADVAVEEYAIGQLDLDADLDLAGMSASSLLLEVARGDLDGIGLERLTLRGSGLPADHRFELTLRSSEGDADASLEGRLDEPVDADPIWHFRLTDARLAHPELAPWLLAESAGGRVGREVVSVSTHCWASGDARLCLGGEQTATALDVAFELTGLAFDYFAPLLPDDYEVSGALEAAGALAQRDDGPLTGELELVTSAGAIEMPHGEPAARGATRFRLEPSHARLAFTPAEATADLALVLEHGQLRLSARLSDPGGDTPLAERPLLGALSIDIPDLAFVAGLTPEVTESGGRVTGQLDLGGTLATPALTGRVMLADGRAQIPEAGTTLTDIDLALGADGSDVVLLSASARSGEGTIALTGVLSVFDAVPTADLRLQGEEFELANTRDARIVVTPDLTIVAGAERIDVAGEVFIPRAAITPQDVPAGAIAASGDQVLVGAGDELAPEPPQPLHARVRIRLGDEVHFDGFGLTARFEGNVVAVQRPESPVTGTGELRILDGEYRAYGQGLVIESGRIFFAGGPITEPAIDLRAVRRPQQGILVGAHVVGTLEEPEFTLFSEPSMTQQEQLSWLVLGRSLQEAPAGERSALSQAALALGVRGGDFLARNIGDRLGLDQLTIDTGTGEAGAPDDPGEAALVAGLYLTPRLYVSYGIGLFDPINVLRIQYTVARQWEIVTESSSEATGADIIYRVERGK